MLSIDCPRCKNRRGGAIVVDCDIHAQLKGTVTCLVCLHEFPITIVNGRIRRLDTGLPGTQSDNLNATVPVDIKEDVKEAERANYADCLKAAVTMCRRALQLGLIDRQIDDAPLSKMLTDAKSKNLLTQKTYDLATSIKAYGDIGAHRREKLDSEEVMLATYATVRMLNELFV